MIDRPNFMFINHELVASYVDMYGKSRRLIHGAKTMDFVFIQEEDGTYTVHKNRYNGSHHCGWSYQRCLDLVEVAYRWARDIANED